MENFTELNHERVDDIPLLVGLMKDMGLAEIINQCVPTHGNHRGLDHGNMLVACLSFILSEGDHRKVSVEPWVKDRLVTLRTTLGASLTDKDFTDDRLGIFLRYLGMESVWNNVEHMLWANTMRVIPPNNGVPGVRLDATTVSGYHTIFDGGIMQLGNSKAHRPDLPQFKLMSASHQPSGCLIATSLHPGQCADDPLYVPIMARVRSILNNMPGILFIGDCKMASLATRAFTVNSNCSYLVPLPMTGKTVELLRKLVLHAKKHPGELEDLLGIQEGSVGFETTRSQSHVDETTKKVTEWKERLLVVRTMDTTDRQIKGLLSRIRTAEGAIKKLSPQPGRGKRVFRTKESLENAVLKALDKHDVKGLLDVSITSQESKKIVFVGRGRGAKNRPTKEVVETRYFVQGVKQLQDAIKEKISELGWRLFATNKTAEELPLSRSILEYRKGWCLEQSFHVLKDQPIGISPLFVQTDEQIKGLTNLLLLANRIFSEIELRVRGSLKARNETIAGLSLGSPKQETATPTAKSLLKKVAREQITLTRIAMNGQIGYHLSTLSPTVEKILFHLGLRSTVYGDLREIEKT